MDIDFKKYFVEDADDYRGGYENSLNLISDLNKLSAFRELFSYQNYDLSYLSQHSLAVFFSQLMNKLQENNFSIKEKIKNSLKFWVKMILRRMEKKGKIMMKSRKGMKKVVCFLYSSSQTDTMFPVLKKLNENKKISLKVVSETSFSQKKLEKEGIKYTPFEDYIQFNMGKILRAEKKNFEKNFRVLNKNNFKYNQKDLWKLVKERFWQEIAWGIEQIDVVKRVMDIEKPDLVLTATDISVKGKAEVLLCRERKIPVIVSQHGAAIDVAYYQPTLSDKFVVWGEATKKMLIHRGYEPKKIVVVGSTKYDGIKIPEKTSKGKFILIATQMVSEKEQKMFLDTVIKACKKIKERIIVNLHPGQKPDLIKKYLKKYNLRAEILPGQPPQGINYFIEKCKLLITICSTISIDAFLVNKPVITVNLSGKKDLLPFAEYGGAIGVWNKENMTEAIKKVLCDKKTREKLKKGRKNFLKLYLYKNDGKASLRFAKLVENTLKI